MVGKNRAFPILRLVCFTLVLASQVAFAPLSASANEGAEALQSRIEVISGDASVGGASIAAAEFIQSFYAHREYRTAWLGKATADQLFTEITASRDHGLRPQDFHAEALASLREAAATGDPSAVAEFEIVATDAAIALDELTHELGEDPKEKGASGGSGSAPRDPYFGRRGGGRGSDGSGNEGR